MVTEYKTFSKNEIYLLNKINKKLQFIDFLIF